MSAGGAAANEERSGTRLLLLVVVSAIFVAVLNQTFVNVVVPDIQRDFGSTPGQVGWVITGYLLVFAIGIPLYGRIADLYSLRTTFAVGLIILGAASLFCAFAPNLPLLVAGRVLQAVGASAIPALGFAAVAKALPPGERGTALGLLSSAVGVGAAVGPVLGGFIAGLADWHVLFFLTVVLALGLAAAVPYALPNLAPEAPAKLSDALHRFDVPGGLMLAFSAGLLLFGVTQGQVLGFASPVAWGSFVLAAALAVGFAWRIRRAPEPFVSPTLFGNGPFLAPAVAGFFMMFANVGVLVLTPFLLSEVNGLPAIGIGLVLAPGAAAVAVLSPLAGRLSDRFGPRALIRSGVLIILASALFLATLGAGASAVMVALGVLGLGVGFAAANSPNSNAAAASLSRDESGVGLGIYQMIFFLGGGFGPAVSATFLAFRQQSGAAALNPLYALDAGPFSDAFMLIALAAAVSFAATFGIAAGTKGKEPKSA